MTTASSRSTTAPTLSWRVQYAEHHRTRRAVHARQHAIRTEIAIRQLSMPR